MEQFQKRVESLMDEFEHATRTTQLRSFECCADCARQTSSSAKEYNHCLDRCTQPVAALQQRFQEEMHQMQGRLNRCAQVCNDKAQGNEGAFNACVDQCARDHEQLLPEMMARLRTML